jgi:hypothetical protein
MPNITNVAVTNERPRDANALLALETSAVDIASGGCSLVFDGYAIGAIGAIGALHYMQHLHVKNYFGRL